MDLPCDIYESGNPSRCSVQGKVPRPCLQDDLGHPDGKASELERFRQDAAKDFRESFKGITSLIIRSDNLVSESKCCKRHQGRFESLAR